MRGIRPRKRAVSWCPFHAAEIIRNPNVSVRIVPIPCLRINHLSMHDAQQHTLSESSPLIRGVIRCIVRATPYRKNTVKNGVRVLPHDAEYWPYRWRPVGGTEQTSRVVEQVGETRRPVQDGGGLIFERATKSGELCIARPEDRNILYYSQYFRNRLIPWRSGGRGPDPFHRHQRAGCRPSPIPRIRLTSENT